MGLIFCPLRTTSIQIHNNNALFCQSAEKKFNFNHLLPENTNIGCEKYYASHWNGNFWAWMIQQGNLRKLVSNKHAKLDHQLWLLQQNNEAFCVYESMCASVDRAVSEVKYFIACAFSDLIIQLSEVCKSFPCCYFEGSFWLILGKYTFPLSQTSWLVESSAHPVLWSTVRIFTSSR